MDPSCGLWAEPQPCRGAFRTFFGISFLVWEGPGLQVASLARVPRPVGAGLVLCLCRLQSPSPAGLRLQPHLLLCIPALLDVLILVLNLAVPFWSPVLIFDLFLLCV